MHVIRAEAAASHEQAGAALPWGAD
jgi:hypothetical protein